MRLKEDDGVMKMEGIMHIKKKRREKGGDNIVNVVVEREERIR